MARENGTDGRFAKMAIQRPRKTTNVNRPVDLRSASISPQPELPYDSPPAIHSRGLRPHLVVTTMA